MVAKNRQQLNVLMLVDNMAEKYGQLPSAVLANSTTLDIQIHQIVERHKDRERKRASGEPVDATVPENLEELYNQWRQHQ